MDYREIKTEGITRISTTDVMFAEKIGYVIKLIGAAEIDENNKISAMVAPRLVPNSSLLSGVNDVFNAILVHGDSLGDAIFYGRGAGKLPTASAVVADVIDGVKHLHTNKWVIWEADAEGRVKKQKTAVIVILFVHRIRHLWTNFPVQNLLAKQKAKQYLPPQK